MSHRDYAFRGEVPLNEVAAGTSVLVAGPITSGARELALTLALPERSSEGSVFAATTVDGETLLNQCGELDPDLDRSRIRIVDATGGSPGASGSPDWLRRVADPGDLTALGMALSSATDDLAADGLSGIRIGVPSVSGLLADADFRPVSRLVHLLAGRVEAIGGLGVFYVDTSTGDDRAADTLAKLCDARIDVRETDGPDEELRSRRLTGQPEGWVPFSVDVQWPRGIGDHLISRQLSTGEEVGRRFSCVRCDFSSAGELDVAALSATRCR